MNLISSLKSGRLAHAYIFAGPACEVLQKAALDLARAANCSKVPLGGCPSGDEGTCESCSKIYSDQHADVVVLRPLEGKSSIAIEVIRKRVIPMLAMPPHEATHRFIIIEEATALLGPSANALLKILEEPPPNTYFILCTTSPRSLLATLRSRCQRVLFKAEPASNLSEGEKPAPGHDPAMLLDSLRGKTSITSAADYVVDHKEAASGILVAFADALLQDSKQKATQGDRAGARLAAKQVTRVLQTRHQLSTYNAHLQSAVLGLLADLRSEAKQAS